MVLRLPVCKDDNDSARLVRLGPVEVMLDPYSADDRFRA